MPTKVILLGSSGVGKTSLIQVKVNGQIGDSLATIQPQEIHYTQQIEGCQVDISVWDTPGQYTFRNMVKNFLRDATGIILTYDVSNRESFDELEEWIHFVNETISPRFIILVANKCDLERVVDVQTENEWANQHQILKTIQTSAITKEGVSLLFDIIAQKAYEFQDKNKGEKQINIDSGNTGKKKKCCH